MPLVRSSNHQTPTTSASQPDLKPCPRSNFTQGHNDWFQVTSPTRIENFDICPDCYNNSFRNTRYASCISRGPAKPANIACACDFSMSWTRIAYTWLFAQNQPDLRLLGELSRLQPDSDGACPNANIDDPEVAKGGKPSVARTWYSLQDPSTGTLLDELTACSHCVAHINTIFPILRHIFKPVANGRRVDATCDLMTGGVGQQRFLEYIDQMAQAAHSATETGALNLSRLISYVKKWAPVPICTGANLVTSGQKQFCLPSTVPEFTACEECTVKHILPLLSPANTAPALLAGFSARDSHPNGFFCDLFSPRLQAYFADACRTGDADKYRRQLTDRFNKAQEIDARITRMRTECAQLKRQSQMHMNQMAVAKSAATMANRSWSVGVWTGVPFDWSATNAEMAKANEKAMQAAILEDGITDLQQEWIQNWK
ncbi:ser arg-related nuclear matrix protein [Stemphylium lycopersici]|nr:ser arg-related nuclear matrix protein [Stemphylium lycopersici]RAR01098.1 ser arg-related nuclear matrix protein [Stemphylium lycopersici]